MNYVWLIVAGVLLVCELFTTTLYLLVLALAAGFALCASALGFAFVTQAGVFLLSSVGMTALLHRHRRLSRPVTSADNALDFDQGAVVFVTHWQQGVGQAHYRGASWAVVLAHPEQTDPPDAAYRIVRIDGVRLVVAPVE